MRDSGAACWAAIGIWAGPCPNPQGTMPASSRKPCAAANPKRRAKTPALHCGRERETTRKRQARPDPTAGRSKERPLRRGPCCFRFCCPCALYCGREREPARKRQPRPDPSAGRCNHRPVRRALPARRNPAKGLRPRRYRTCRRHGNHHTSSLLPRARAGWFSRSPSGTAP